MLFRVAYRSILFSGISAIILFSPQANAASCQDGVKVKAGGIIAKVIEYDSSAWLFIETKDVECGPLYIKTTKKRAKPCPLGSTIHLEGRLLKPGVYNQFEGWVLTDGADGGKGDFRGALSCSNAPPPVPGLESAKPGSGRSKKK